MRKASGGGAPSGNEEVDKIGSQVHTALIQYGISYKDAATFSLFCMNVVRYIQANPELLTALKAIKEAHDLYGGLHKMSKSSIYMKRAADLGLLSSRTGFFSYGASGGAKVLEVFKGYFEGYAKGHGIELNECSMALVKVSLDAAAAGSGLVTSVAGFGIVVTGFAVLSTLKDGYTLGQVCFGEK